MNFPKLHDNLTQADMAMDKCRVCLEQLIHELPNENDLPEKKELENTVKRMSILIDMAFDYFIYAENFTKMSCSITYHHETRAYPFITCDDIIMGRA